MQEVYPRFVLYVPEADDIAGLVDGLAKLIPLGLKVPQNFVRDKLGIPDPQDDEELLQAPSPQGMMGMGAPAFNRIQEREYAEWVANGYRDPCVASMHSNHPKTRDAQVDAFKALNNEQERLHDIDADDDMDGFINVTEQSIKALVGKLQAATSFNEILDMLNDAELNSSDIADALALSGIKAFADGVK